MNRLPGLATLLVIALGLTACDEIISSSPESVGQTGDILVVTDSLTWNGPVGDAIREELGGGLRTLPQPEPAFRLQRQDLTETFFPQIRRQHSVLFVAPYDSPTATGRFLRARLGDAGVAALEGGGVGIIRRPNLWAENQLVVYATAPDEETLASQIRARAGELRQGYDAVNRHRLTREMFRRGRQVDVEQRLMQEHGFAVNVQHDYVVVRDTTFETVNRTPGTFVRMRRIAEADSWREVFVYYEPDVRLERLHPDSVRALRNRLSRKFVRGGDDLTYVHIEDRHPGLRPVVTDTVNFNGRWALETRGTWYLGYDDGRSAGMGGPFVSYAFFDEDSGRFYLIDGMVFAPRYPKREFLRQVEVIAHTFRARDGDELTVIGDRILEDSDAPPSEPSP